jgi:hypothetical protein
VGEPVLIRILNAGLWLHSMHIHANHVYVVGMNINAPAGASPISTEGFTRTGGSRSMENPLWVDVMTLAPMDCIDWLVPYMRPPDVPNTGGIGRAVTPLTDNNGHLVWPPNDELNIHLPNNLVTSTGVQLGVQLSPLCYPMHDHSEPSQTAQGGNYNMGLISGINFTGDRNAPVGARDFPNQPIVYCPGTKNWLYTDGVYPTAVQPPWFA